MDDNLTPPQTEIDPTDDAIKNFKRQRVEALNEMYKKLTQLYAYERDLAVYRLFKNEGVSVLIISRAFDLTPARVYQMIETFALEYGEKHD